MHSEAGKGDKRRPGNQEAYNASWERVFGKAIWIEDGDLGSGWSCPACGNKYIDGRLPKDCEVLTCPGKTMNLKNRLANCTNEFQGNDKRDANK